VSIELGRLMMLDR